MTPILFIPGLLCSADVFAAQVATLWPYGPTTIASPLEGNTIEEVAARILANAPPLFAMAGLSMGGYISLEIMRQAPNRVIKPALIDTSARPDTAEQSAQRRATVEEARQGDFLATALEGLTNLLHPARRSDPDLRVINVRMASAVGLQGFATQQELIMSRPDSRPFLSAIAAPTLVLVGDTDALTPVDRAQEMASAIPGAILTIVPESGHLSTIERPNFVSKALLDWISR